MDETKQPVQAVVENAAEKIALDRCDELIGWYQKNQAKQRNYRTSNRLVAVVLSGLVPVLVIVQMSFTVKDAWWLSLSLLIALFPAVTTIFTTLNDLFQYKENWIRYTIALEELKSEKLKYQTRTTRLYQSRLDDHEALSNFVFRIESITLGETRKWQSLVEQAKDLEELIKPLDKKPD
jgi:hypothetical protein